MDFAVDMGSNNSIDRIPVVHNLIVHNPIVHMLVITHILVAIGMLVAAIVNIIITVTRKHPVVGMH